MSFHRDLGLTVPVAEVLDPSLWRQRYAYGIALGPGNVPADNAVCKKGSLLDLMKSTKGAQTKAGQTAAALDTVAFAELVDTLPDELIRWHLRAALSELETKLGIPMGLEVVKSEPLDAGLVKGVHYDRLEPRRPFSRVDQQNWYQITLPNGVISVERVRAYWFGTLVWEISEDVGNQDLLTLEWGGVGSAHILPTSLSNLLITAPGLGGSGYGAMQLIHGWASPLPGVWAVDYTRGPKTKTGEVGQIEAVLAHWVYAVAGVLLFSIGGLARSQGLTNASVSIDGLSRSVGLQASAIYGINSALEEALRKASDRIDWKRLRTYKRGLRVYPFGG